MTDSRGATTVTGERRRTARRRTRLPVVVASAHGVRVAADTVDVSTGGMRVESTTRMPAGPVVVDVLDGLALHGTVVEEQLDADTGLVMARIAFTDLTPVARRHLEAITATGPATGSTAPAASSRRRVLAVGVGVALPLAIVAGLLVASQAERGESDAGAPSSGIAEGASGDITPTTDPAPATTVPPEATTSLPVPTTTATPAVTATSAAPEAPAATSPPPAPAEEGPAMVATSETADNTVFVRLREPPEETSVASSVGPSAGVDQVRVELTVTPQPDGTSLPVSVVVTNRGDAPIRFPDGLAPRVTADRDGVRVREATFERRDVVDLAPGATIEVGGLFDFGSTGDYEMFVEIDTVRPAED